MKVIQLGSKVTDSITGFTGIVTGHVVYLTGCNQSLVQPRAKDGEFKGAVWFDDDRLTVELDPPITLPSQTTNGFDVPAPVR